MKVCISCNEQVDRGRFYEDDGKTKYICEDCTILRVNEMMKMLDRV